ncbi:MAG: hypothetical protein ABI461_16905, partial [Polyangiaceae bacterium]
AGTTIAYFLQGLTYPGVQLLGLAPSDANPSDGLIATWRGSVSTTANLWALAYMRDASTGVPTSYIGFATSYAFLIDQRDATFAISLQAIATSSMSLNFQPPDGYSVENADVAIDVGPGSTPAPIAHLTSPTGTVTFPVPDMPSNRLLATSTATRGADSSRASMTAVAYPNGSADVTFAFPATTQLGSPNDGATDVDSTTPFSWNGSGVSELLFSSAAPNAPTIRVVTDEQSFTLEQFPALSITPLPANAHYTWSARHWPDFAATDAFEAAGIDLVTANVATSGAHGFTMKSPGK